MPPPAVDSSLVRSMLETEFKPGEQLKHWAVGTKRAGVKTWVGLFIGMIAATLLLTVLGIRPGLIGTPLWIVLTCAIMAPIARAADKHYAVGISDSRLFGFTLRPKLVSTAIGLEDRTGTFNCPLAEIKDVRARRIVRGTTVRIVGRNLRVVATCPDAAMEGNKEQWAGIVATLQSMTNSSLDAERQDTPPNPGHQADG